MSSPKVEDEGVLREWAPLSKLLQQIPMRMRQGVFFEDVKFTCVDATIECLVLGTSCGTVFWYDRSSHFVQQLRLEKCSNCVTAVKVVSTVDFMVAAGDNTGVVSIFKIPKSIDGNEGFIPNLAEKIERYIVDGLHKSKVTALDWSINGQKLFSGDSEGIVVFTEMDFVMNLSKAREIVNERYSIVQLSYNQKQQLLLISSELRCIIWRNIPSGHTVTQIGQRERPSLISVGGTFICDPSGDISIFSCRGGLKLWRADLDGNVKFTLLFKDALKKCKNAVKFLKPLESLDKPRPCEFGKLYSWRDGLFVSYTKHSIIVIDPAQVTVVSSLLNAKEIVCVSTTRTELFVIAGKRDLIRLGYTPDLCDSSVGGFGNMAQAETVSSIPAVNLTPIVGSPLSTSYTLSSQLSASMANSEPSSCEVSYGQDPAVLPPVVSIHDGVPELRIEPSRYQQYTSIGQQGFDDIIYSQNRSQKHKTRRKSREISENKSTTLGISLNGVATYFNSIGQFLNGEFSPTVCDGELENLETVIPKVILPDMRSIDAIVEDVARKEVLLDAMLESFKQEDPILSDNDASFIDSNSNNASPSGSTSSNPIEVISRKIFEIELEKPDMDKTFLICSGNNSHLNAPIEPTDTLDTSKVLSDSTFEDIVEEKSVLNEIEVENNNGIFISNTPMLEEPLSEINSSSPAVNKMSEGSMFEISLTEDTGKRNILECLSSHCDAKEECAILDCGLGESSPKVFPSSITESSFYSGWCSLSCQGSPIFLSSWKHGLIMCTPNLNVYVYSGSSWSLLNYKAECVIVSASGNLGLKKHCALAHYSSKWCTGIGWKKMSKAVQYAAVLDEKIWFISNGDLFYFDLNEGIIHNHLSQTSLSKVFLYKRGLLFISESGRIFLLENEDWKIIRGIKSATFLSVGPKELIWVVDSNNVLYVTDCISNDKPIWWQVPVGDTKCNEIVSLCSSDDGIYLAFRDCSSIHFNKTYVTGHRWISVTVKFECMQIAASGVFEEKGCIWILDKKNKLITLDNSFNTLKEVPSPCRIVCIASSPGALWLLSDDGCVYLRQGITDNNPVGAHWRKLNLEQLHSQIEMIWISCGPDVVWACDIRGKIIMLVGSPHSIANDSVDPAWVPVDGKPIDNNTFTKVYVGPDTYMVWALDNAGNIYVREAVFPTFPLGTGWVHVPDIKASLLAISSEAVYALNQDGVYKRLGISQSNYIGDAWALFPVQLDYIAASFDLGLFGICSRTRQLVSHMERKFPMSDHITVEKDWALL